MKDVQKQQKPPADAGGFNYFGSSGPFINSYSYKVSARISTASFR